MNNFALAFILTSFAGLATGIGAFMAMFAKKINTRFLSLSMGLSAGVMIFISLAELLPEAQKTLFIKWDKFSGIIAYSSFFTGVILTAIIDMIVPKMKNPHEVHRSKHDLDELKKNRHHPQQLLRLGIFTAIALALHNFPEGLAAFLSAMSSPTIALPIIIAIAIHNIPEGIAVYVPIYYATGSKKKAFIYSFLSGLAEPLGGVVGYFLLKQFLGETMFGITYSMVAGIMVYISFDELLPTAKEYGNHHLSVLGLFMGMLIIAISLAIL